MLNELARRLRAELPALVDETEGRLHREQPELIARVDPAVLREGIAMTHERFFALIEGRAADDRDRHVQLSAGIAGAGITVEGLLAGYRVGAQVGWRHTARIVSEIGAPAEAVLALATASLAYMDALAADSLEGFALGAAAIGGARARERQALVDALVAGRAADAAALAEAARWALPQRLRVAVLLPPASAAGMAPAEAARRTRTSPAGIGRPGPAPRPPAEAARLPRTSTAGIGRTGAGALGGIGGGGMAGAGAPLDDRTLLLGHVDGTALAIARDDEEGERALLHAGVALAAGPAVPPEQAPLSLVRARRVAALALAGVLPGEGALLWEDHLPELILHADTAAVEALAARRLAPLEGLPPARERLLRETLAAWLDHPGRPREIARDLQLHHQTVRYRLARLRERFGDDLDDPDARFELALALRAAGPRAE
ncbi:MAG TPA: helix-turn-helix domain-containing protein [Baekduia sp.]